MKLAPRLGALASVFLFAGTMFGAAPSQAQEPKPIEVAPFAPIVEQTDVVEHRLGGFLESRFRKLVRNCTLGPWDFKVDWLRDIGTNKFPVTVVPKELQDVFGLSHNQADDDIYDLSSQTINSLFARVVTGAQAPTELNSDLTATPPGYRALDLTILPQDSRLVMPQFNGSSYSMTCANALGFLYSLKGNYDFPGVAMDAGIQGSASKSAKNSVRVVQGVFYSPFAAMLSGKYRRYETPAAWGDIQRFPPAEARALRRAALLLFWQWYLDNSAARTQQNAILEYFSGVAVSGATNSQSEEALDLSAKSNLQVFGVTSNARANYASSSLSTFQSTNFDIVAFRGNRPFPGAYMPLPSPADISDEFSQFKLSSVGASAPITIFNTNPISFSQGLSGLVGNACDSEVWTVQKADGSGTVPGLKLQRAHVVDNDERIATCVFDFVYTPSTVKSIDLGFRIAMVDLTPMKVGSGASAQTLSLTVAGTPISITAEGASSWRSTDQTYIAAIDNVTNQVAVAGARQLRWRATFQYFGNQDWLITGTPSVTGAVACTDGLALAPINYTTTFTNGQSPTLQIAMATTLPDGATIAADQSPTGKCHFEGQLRYTALVSGQSQDLKQSLRSQDVVYPLQLAPLPASQER